VLGSPEVPANGASFNLRKILSEAPTSPLHLVSAYTHDFHPLPASDRIPFNSYLERRRVAEDFLELSGPATQPHKRTTSAFALAVL
jgi:hypothetical protein